MPNKISKGKRLFRTSFRMAALPIGKESALPKWYIYIAEKVFQVHSFLEKDCYSKIWISEIETVILPSSCNKQPKML